jgi:hypothetical protein
MSLIGRIAAASMVTMGMLAACANGGGDGGSGDAAGDQESQGDQQSQTDAKVEAAADTGLDATEDASEDTTQDGSSDVADAATDTTPASDSGGCMTNIECTGVSEYCAKGAGDCSGVGVCVAKPGACTNIYMPVCGCNHMTYSNACWAEAAGENVDYKSSCE